MTFGDIVFGERSCCCRLCFIAHAPSISPRALRIRHDKRAARQREAQRLLAIESNQSFDLSEGPLLSILLLQLEEDEHLLVSTIHHIAFDGWSLGVFIDELAFFYRGFAAGQSPSLPALPIQYAD